MDTNRPASTAHLVNRSKPWYRFHDLRHSFASMAAAGRLSLPIIGALLGHTRAATTLRYAHLAADPLRQTAHLTGKRIADALAKGVQPGLEGRH